MTMIKIHCVKFSKNYKYCIKNRRAGPRPTSSRTCDALGAGTEYHVSEMPVEQRRKAGSGNPGCSLVSSATHTRHGTALTVFACFSD